jgi:capsular exopolysaccharide synthesis family protein
MNALEKYLDHVIEQKPLNLHAPAPPVSEGESTFSLIVGALRRWYIAVATFLLMCAIGLPAIWLLIKPLYSVTGAIRVAPILTNILSGEADRGEISNYESFVNTEAQRITSSQVVERVADDLAGKKLSFFEDETTELVKKLKRKLKGIKPQPVTILKEAIFDGVITAASDRRTELIKVTVKSLYPQEAEQIVNAFIRNYMAVQVASSTDEEGQTLAVLENERKVLTEKLQSQRAAITQLAQEYGTVTLNGRQDMMLQRVASLLAELTKIEAHRIGLEAQVQLLEQTKEQTITTEDLVRLREEYINKDPTITSLTANIAQLDQAYIAASQMLAPTNPELEHKAGLLKALKERLEERKQEVGKTFNEMMTKEIDKAGSQKLVNTRTELEQTKAYENRLREILTKEDSETVGLGRKQLTIQDLQDQMDLTKQLYDTVSRRIQELEMERKRPARISVAYMADVSEIRDKRIKYSIALIFGAAACGMMLAFLRDKADRSLRTPQDVVRRIGIPILGTTTSSHTVKAALLPGQIAEDYQTIRANLGLLNTDGLPKKIVVTSPGIQEGKTTFAINLATSIAKSGKKVLLIDGDLRKPDIGYLLNLPRGSRGLQDVLLGREFDQVVWSIPSTGLDVLGADSRNAADAYELLALPMIAQQINMISQRYDHVIIDTPPAQAFPDALIWAKLADAVILTSFAGQTTAEDLRTVTERLKQINVKVLGTVLSNVHAGRGYYHYGYNHYYSRNAPSEKTAKRAEERIKMLLPMQNLEGNTDIVDSENPEEK